MAELALTAADTRRATERTAPQVLLQIAALPVEEVDSGRTDATSSVPAPTPHRAAGQGRRWLKSIDNSLRSRIERLPAGCMRVLDRIRPQGPVPTRLWVLMIAITCISGAGLIVGSLKGRAGRNAADVEIVDDIKDIEIDPSLYPPPVPSTDMQPLHVVPPPQFAAAPEPTPAPSVQSAIYQATDGSRRAGAWLEGTILEDEFDAPAANVNYDASRQSPQ